MFYAFVVREDHRDYLRFLWYKDNNLNNNITEYRMKVHIFGNIPSPSVAIYGLQRAAQEHQDEYGTDSKEFVMRNFYVDDGLTSAPIEEDAIDLLKRTQEMLAASNLKLHKIASNSNKVMTAFAPEDLAKDLKNFNLGADPLPLQRSLGLIWNWRVTVSVSRYPTRRNRSQKEASCQQFRASMIHWASWLPSQCREKLWSENCRLKNMTGMILSHQTSK